MREREAPTIDRGGSRSIGGDASTPLFEERCDVFFAIKREYYWGAAGAMKQYYLSQYDWFIGMKRIIRKLLEML
jgi:hypothetical protein